MANNPNPVELEIVAEPSPALANRAIARCARAFEDAYRACIQRRGTKFEAKDLADEAYRAAMPPLTSRDNCRDFIACVAHGILLGAIYDKNSGKLLYAAQVALGAASAEERSREMAGYAVYADLTETGLRCAKKLLSPRSKIA